MPLEDATYLFDLVPANPPGTDGVSQGDDHLRMIKQVLQNTFPLITGPGLPITEGTPSAWTVTYPYAPAAYTDGQVLLFMAGGPALGPATISVNGGPAVPMQLNNLPLKPQDMMPGNAYMLVYFNNCFNLIAASTGLGGGGVESFNTRTGDVTLAAADVTGVGGALLASPAFTGTPTAPTPPQTSNDGTLSTTQFVVGMINTSRATSVISFNGRYQVVTLTLADITGAGGAPINSPNFTGAATVFTPIAGDNSTLIANTAFVVNALTSYAPLLSPTFTGVPAAPTAVPGTNTTQLATTAFVAAALTATGVSSFNGRTGAVTLISGDISGAGGALTTDLANYLPLTGGILTGALTVNANANFNNPVQISSGSGNSSIITMVKMANSLANIIFGNRSSLQRWALYLGNSDPESTGNAGTNFQLTRYADASGVIDNPLVISRATGQATFSQSPVVPTPPLTDNSTNVATTAYIKSALANMRWNGTFP